jgi:hypothetical protein
MHARMKKWPEYPKKKNSLRARTILAVGTKQAQQRGGGSSSTIVPFRAKKIFDRAVELVFPAKMHKQDPRRKQKKRPGNTYFVMLATQVALLQVLLCLQRSSGNVFLLRCFCAWLLVMCVILFNRTSVIAFIVIKGVRISLQLAQRVFSHCCVYLFLNFLQDGAANLQDVIPLKLYL